MKTSQVVLIALVTPTIVQICLAMLPKEGNKSMRCVHMPQYFWVISVITGVMCAVLGLVGWLKQLVICIVFAICLGIISCVFLLMYRSLYIVYNDAGFTVKQIFRLTRQFSYEEVEAVTFGHSLLQFTLHTKKGRIFVDQLAVGQISFYKYTEGKYQEATGRRTIPQKEPRLFHGYVRSPGEIAFFPCLVLVLFIAAAVLITGDSLKLLGAPKELLRRNVQITSWSTENDMVYFTTAYGKLWVQWDAIADFEVLQSDMGQGQTFSVIFEPPRRGGYFPGVTRDCYGKQSEDCLEKYWRHMGDGIDIQFTFVWWVLYPVPCTSTSQAGVLADKKRVSEFLIPPTSKAM